MAKSPSHPVWPFVGRVAQLKMVRQVLAHAEPGAGALVLIDGEPGLGKSRFLHEVAARESRSAVVISLGCTAASGIGGKSLAEQLAAALRERDLHVLARQRPILCTVDDVQKATPDDRTVVDTLVQASAMSRIVVLAACTAEWSGIGSTMPAWLDAWTRAGAVSMNLARLDPPRSEILLRAMLSACGETADAQTTAAILRIAAGSPRYLRELVNRLPEVRSGNAQLIPRSAEAQIVRLRSAFEPAVFAILREASAFGSEFAEEWLVRLAPPAQQHRSRGAAGRS